MKFQTTAALAFSLLAAPAFADGLSGIRCESPEVIAIMEDQLRGSTADGRSLVSHGVFIQAISKAVTMHSSPTKLVCGVTLRVSGYGNTATMRIRYTYQQFAGGKRTATATPY